MINKDYILRLIEQFAKVLAKILKLIMNQQHPEALKTIDQTFQHLFGFNSKFINSISDDDLIEMMKSGEALDADKCIMIALLLKAEGDVYDAQSNLDESYDRYLRSLLLLLEAFSADSDANLSTHYSEIGTIINKLQDEELPDEIKSKLLRYYEKVGQYSKAEDLLFELIETNSFDQDILEEGIHFYERLIVKSDSELIAGNLPRDEVHEGLSGLEKLRRE